MKQLPLTSKQVEICDFILKNNNIQDTYGKLEDIGFSDFDNKIASRFLVDNKLITSIHPVVLTDIGSRYLDKGIIKFIKRNRQNDFLNSVIIRTIAVWTGILISLAFGVTNYIQNRENKHNDGIYIKHSEIDSILHEKGFKNSDSPSDKFAIKEFIKDTTNHIDKNLKIDK